MRLVFSNNSLPTVVTKSLFLAGPSPRRPQVADWRHEALAILKELGFTGTVFLPVPNFLFYGQKDEAAAQSWTYDNQVGWEVLARQMADCLVFWVPRVVDRSEADLGMPAFTTNFELGEDLSSGKVVYGRPDDAVKCSYLDQRVTGIDERVHTSLRELLSDAVQRLGDGAERSGGEAQVPLHVWRSEAFQAWYSNLKVAGNRLDGAELLSCVFVGPKRHLFTFSLKVRVWVASEQRHKSNEIIIPRKDVSAVFAFCGRGPFARLALVREFRSPVSNPEGFLYELPGGSSSAPGVDPCVCAQQELSEETGLLVSEPHRFLRIGQRQLAATFATHRATVYAIELTPEEFAVLEGTEAKGTAFGAGDSEQTYVITTTLAELPKLQVDYSTLGMVFEAATGLGVL